LKSLLKGKSLVTGLVGKIRQGLSGASITWRLGAAFGAVALLAVAANLTWERGVIQTTRTFTPGLIARPAPPRVLPVVVEPTPVSAPQPTVNKLNDSELFEALAEIDRVVALRARAPGATDSALTSSTNQKLLTALTSFLKQSPTLTDGSRADSLRAETRKLRAAADEFIRVSDARRAALGSYNSHFEVIDSSLKSTLDHNWTIFGRVIARQSIVSMSRDLDELRRQSAQLNASDGYDPAVLSALEHGESQFSQTLEHNASGLIRAQGAPWVAQLRQGLLDLSTNRTQLAALGQQAGEASSAFERKVKQVGVLVRSITEVSAREVLAGATVGRTPTAAGGAAGQPVGRPDTSPLPTQPVEQISTRETARSLLSRSLFAVISAAVLFAVLAISLTTVRSISSPVDQFAATAKRLAEGDAAARFERGGLRELDTLAVSLNSMASTLEDAQAITREYQGVLELRIEERTQQLQRMAERDLLTGLPNRKQFLSKLTAALTEAHAASGFAAVIFIDLDNFKNLNDSMGHTIGDRVLQAVARRLSLLAESAGATAARLGGDEFAVMLPTCAGEQEVRQRGQELLDAFRQPLAVGGRDLLIMASLGAVIYPEHAPTAEALLSAADAAVFHSKSLGRDQLTVFSPDLLERVTQKFNTEQSLRRAVERGEFELVFQPEVSAQSGEVHLVEALIRWRLPDGQRISPLQFLPVAEETGLIVRIGDWVLRTAIQTAAQWHRGLWPQVRVAINVSPSQLLSEGFAKRVQQLLIQHDLPARCIEIELTETALQTGASCVDTLHELRNIGVGVALDDFGTGFSSLASLQHLPLTRVKLDQSLTASIDRSSRAAQIADAIVSLCARLGFEVTVEGIERSEQLALLLEHRAVTLQGYLLSRPLDEEAVALSIAAMPERFQSFVLESAPAPAPATRTEGPPELEFWASKAG
jgi:diguanylate cyclase (GGDEF)-like protein